MINIGVVCEGPTDFIAIEAFYHDALYRRGIESEFVSIHPNMDNTTQDAGWGNVLVWLSNNPPSERIRMLSAFSPFMEDHEESLLDCLLIQLDADILGNDSFQNYVGKRYGYKVAAPSDPAERAMEIEKVLKLAWRDREMTAGDKNLHVPLPVVESTEAWCLAAYSRKPDNFELVIGRDLVEKFMVALETSEGRHARGPYAKIDKRIKRRRKFCEVHAKNSSRIVCGCYQFEKALCHLMRL